MGNVVKEIAADAIMSQKLMKHIIRWYVVDSLLCDLNTKYMTVTEDTKDVTPVIVGTMKPAFVV